LVISTCRCTYYTGTYYQLPLLPGT